MVIWKNTNEFTAEFDEYKKNKKSMLLIYDVFI